jgi:hypothetical protein
VAVAITALSAPVTANRFRLWQLEKLNAVADKTPDEDPARPYLQAEVRKRTAWWAATTASKMSPYSRGVLVFEMWIVAIGVRSIIWPNPVMDFPFIWLWSKIPITLFAALRVVFAFRRMRVDRVRFYNTLIDAGPEEFAMTLRKALRVPRLFGESSTEAKLGRLPTRGTSHHLEVQNVRTCPNGHPVNGGSLLVSDYDFDKRPPRSLLCGRCLSPLPLPLTSDIDEDERDILVIREVRKRKLAQKAKNAAAKAAEPKGAIASASSQSVEPLREEEQQKTSEP